MSRPLVSQVLRFALFSLPLSLFALGCVQPADSGEEHDGDDESEVAESNDALVGYFPRFCDDAACDIGCSESNPNAYGVCVLGGCQCQVFYSPDPGGDIGGSTGCSGSGDCALNQHCDLGTRSCVDNFDPCEDPNYAQLHLCDCNPSNIACQ